MRATGINRISTEMELIRSHEVRNILENTLMANSMAKDAFLGRMA